MTGPADRGDLGAELEDLISRYGLVRIVDALGAICAERAHRIGRVLEAQKAAGGIRGLLRGLGEYIAKREGEG